MFLNLLRYAQCAATSSSSSSEVIHFIDRDEYSKQLDENCEWMKELDDTSKYKKTGPRFPDGSINWQCPCMAGGSLVAHRCGHAFRHLYLCMKDNEGDDATVKCPSQFIDWAACMQNMSEERRQQMRQNLLDQNDKETNK